MKLIETLKNIDLDDALAYNTIKLARIRDRYLGAMHYIFMIAIFIYIIIFQVIIFQGYLLTEAPRGDGVRASLRAPKQMQDEATDYMFAGMYLDAIETYTNMLRLCRPTALILARRGLAFVRANCPCAAIRDTNEALKMNPDSSLALKVRGEAYRLLGQYDKALSDLKKAVQLDYDDRTESLRRYCQQRIDNLNRYWCSSCSAFHLRTGEENLKDEEEQRKTAARKDGGGGGGNAVEDEDGDDMPNLGF